MEALEDLKQPSGGWGQQLQFEGCRGPFESGGGLLGGAGGGTAADQTLA